MGGLQPQGSAKNDHGSPFREFNLSMKLIPVAAAAPVPTPRSES